MCCNSRSKLLQFQSFWGATDNSHNFLLSWLPLIHKWHKFDWRYYGKELFDNSVWPWTTLWILIEFISMSRVSRALIWHELKLTLIIHHHLHHVWIKISLSNWAKGFNFPFYSRTQHDLRWIKSNSSSDGHAETFQKGHCCLSGHKVNLNSVQSKVFAQRSNY